MYNDNMRHCKPDRNKKEIAEAARACGCCWFDQDVYAGFDAVLVAPNGIHIVEVKASSNYKLTPNEIMTKAMIENVGKVYNIIITVDDVIALIGFA